MNKKQRKNLDSFFNGTFKGGGIFDEPAKVQFKYRDKGPGFEEVLEKAIKNRTTPAEEKGLEHDHKQRAEVNKAIQGRSKDLDRIKKLEALANDPCATAGERDNAKRMIKKLRG